MFDDLVFAIKNYESDTFSGGNATIGEARRMARLLWKRFMVLVEESGTMRMDGDVLAALLDEVRAS